MPLTSTGAERVLLVDGQVVRAAVDLAGAREHDASVGILMTARLEDGELAAAVDLEIGERVGHRVEVARLPREVEQVVLALNQVLQAVLVADVGDVHADLVLDPRDVVEVAAVLGDQRVDENDAATRLDEHARQVRADEAEPAGDQDALAAELLSELEGGQRALSQGISGGRELGTG